VDRGLDGAMKIAPPPARQPSLKELHARKCFLLGITSPGKVERLWREEVERRKAAEGKGKKKRGR
jgi:hypothetical protein